jgi:hypothetical protein
MWEDFLTPSNFYNITMWLRTIFFVLILLRRILFIGTAPYHQAYLPPVEQHYTFERINERYLKDDYAYQKVMALTSSSFRRKLFFPWSSLKKTRRQSSSTLSESVMQKMTSSSSSSSRFLGVSSLTSSLHRPNHNYNNNNGTVIVLDWTDLDTSISQMDTLRDKVSFIIHEYQQYHHRIMDPHNHENENDPIDNNNKEHNLNHDNTNDPSLLLEVIVLLESPGGSASDYALAASQLMRMKQMGITVTICVDKIAASGMCSILFVTFIIACVCGVLLIFLLFSHFILSSIYRATELC